MTFAEAPGGTSRVNQMVRGALGLKFIPTPRYTTNNITETIQRFTKNILCKIFFKENNESEDESEEDEYDKDFYVKSNWYPKEWMIPPVIIKRLKTFTTICSTYFKKQRCPSNLLQYQQRMLQHLQLNNELIVATSHLP